MITATQAPMATDAPSSFVNLIQGDIVNPMSRTFHANAVKITEGPLYFVCMVQGPDKPRKIEYLGPVELPTEYEVIAWNRRAGWDEGSQHYSDPPNPDPACFGMNTIDTGDILIP